MSTPDPGQPPLHFTGDPDPPAPIKFPARKEEDGRGDALLVSLASRGDDEAFMALYRRHKNFVMNVARRFTRDESEALDVLQDTFAYLLKRLPDLRLTAKLSTFLYPAVKNIALTIRRKDRGVALTPSHDRALDAAADSPLSVDIKALIANLPEGQQEVLLLRFVDDLSLREVAAALGIPVGTVKSRLHQAIATLREDPRTRALFDLEESG